MDSTALSFEWRDHYETKIFLQYLEDEIQRIKDGWAGAAYIGENQAQTIHLNAKYMGIAEGLSFAADKIKGE
jgi:hypothetical protein